MKTALVISTYNRPKALAVCLESVKRQSLLPDEVLIADDGSKQDTADLIKEMGKNFPVPIKHIWHEDNGFRLARIRNKAIASTDADFIMQIDGDVFLHKEYVKDFVAVARKGYCILGSRVGLGPGLTEKIEQTGHIPTIYPWTRGISSKPARAIYLKWGRKHSFNYKLNHSKGFGCSMAFWREDFIAINGYDDSFVGWGCEDRDLIRRFLKNGIQNHKLKFIGIVYHLWHKEADRSKHKDNREICYNKNKDTVFCKNGISQFL